MQELRICQKSVLCFLVRQLDSRVLFLEVVVYRGQNLRHDVLSRPFVNLPSAHQKGDTDLYDGDRQITGQQFVESDGFLNENFHVVVNPRVCKGGVPVY